MATHTDQARGSGHLQQETGWGPGRTASLSVLLPWGLGNGALPPLCPHASPSVALLPMPKREREGGPGRKSVLPNNSPLSHTYTHAHTHLTSSLFTPGTTLSTRLARDAAILPHSSQCQNLCQAPWAVPAPTYLTPGSPGLSFSALTKGKTTSPNELASRSSGTISPPGSQMLSWHFPGYSLHFTFPDWKRTNYLIVQLFLRAEL